MSRLIMTILVKNEAEIIEDNIRFHAAQGVDAFLVMDNGSTDGTIEKIESLKQHFDITLQHETGVYQQVKWMNQLAKRAKQELGARWVISNDADEFWATNDGSSLTSKLQQKESVVTVKRFNYVQSLEDMQSNKPYWASPYKVVSPILFSKQEQMQRQGLAMPLIKISPKTIINPRGLLKLKGGNHRARHLMLWRDRFEEAIEVHHFPIRSYQQFANNIKNRASILKKNPQARMGDHYRRWVSQFENGELENEFSRISLTEQDLNVVQKIGVVDHQLSHLSPFMQSMI